MKYFYSAAQNAFYCDIAKNAYDTAGAWPDDAVEVEGAVFEEYAGTAPSGKMRVAGKKGLPAWVDLPPTPHDELVAVANAEKQRRIDEANAYMNSKQWPGKAAMKRLSKEDSEKYNLWLDYLDAIDAVDTSTAPDVSWPDKPA